MNRSSAARALDALANARKMLDAGFTTLRTPASSTASTEPWTLKNAITAASTSDRASSSLRTRFPPPAATGTSTT